MQFSTFSLTYAREGWRSENKAAKAVRFPCMRVRRVAISRKPRG